MDGYLDWRSSLFARTQGRLQALAASGTCLTQLHAEGVYHKLSNEYAAAILASGDGVPADWPCRGFFPGVWCALFDAHNTYSMAVPGTFRILRVHFRPGFRAFDPRRDEHRAEWDAWWAEPANAAKLNEAAWLLPTARGPTLAAKLERGMGIGGFQMCPSMPHHAAFYREHGYAAVVGYSDYMGLVVIDAAAIERVEAVV